MSLETVDTDRVNSIADSLDDEDDAKFLRELVKAKKKKSAKTKKSNADGEKVALMVSRLKKMEGK